MSFFDKLFCLQQVTLMELTCSQVYFNLLIIRNDLYLNILTLYQYHMSHYYSQTLLSCLIISSNIITWQV